MVMKVIVVRDTRDLKSLGLQGLAGSTPARGTKDKCMAYVTYLLDVKYCSYLLLDESVT